MRRFVDALRSSWGPIRRGWLFARMEAPGIQTDLHSTPYLIG